MKNLKSPPQKPDPQKVSAIKEVNRPEDKKELQRFREWSYLAKFIPKHPNITALLREILNKGYAHKIFRTLNLDMTRYQLVERWSRNPKMGVQLPSRQQISRCSLQCQINMNLVFHNSEHDSEIETRRWEFNSRSRQRISRCSLQCQINMNLVFHRERTFGNSFQVLVQIKISPISRYSKPISRNILRCNSPFKTQFIHEGLYFLQGVPLNCWMLDCWIKTWSYKVTITLS